APPTSTLFPYTTLFRSWNRIMHCAPDSFFLEMSQNCVAFLYSNGVDVINVARVIRLERCKNLIESSKSLIVFQGMFAPQGICFVKMTQFDRQHCRLNAVHPAVPSHRGVVIFP